MKLYTSTVLLYIANIALLKSFKFNRFYSTWKSVIHSLTQPPDIMIIIEKVDSFITFLNEVKTIQIDFSAGAGDISSPISIDIYSYNTSDNLMSIPDSLYNESNIVRSLSTERPSPLLRLHQVSKKALKKVPDNALLGILVLIASELLQREVTNKAPLTPPVLRELANSTILELETKLEILSQYQWDFDPFIQSELENLQTQPLEAIDRFIVSEILPKVDKEISPILAKLTTDSTKVKVITNNIKELIQIITLTLLVQPATGNNKTPYLNKEIIETVDSFGKTVEEGIDNTILFNICV